MSAPGGFVAVIAAATWSTERPLASATFSICPLPVNVTSISVTHTADRGAGVLVCGETLGAQRAPLGGSRLPISRNHHFHSP